MIQVLGLRDFTDNGKTKKREVFFQKGWRFDTIEEVFGGTKRTELLTGVAPDERYNLYFTVADCFEEAGRKLKEQWAIPFDIDKLDLGDTGYLDVAESAARAASGVIGVPFEEMGVTFSGNGVQFFVRLATPILTDEYFEQTRPHYNLVCKRIQNKLDELGIKGEVDVSVWSKGRLMRLPDTSNRKPGKPERMAQVLNGNMVPQAFDIVALSGIAELEEPQHITDQVLKNYPKPDTPAICVGCKFLVHCKDNPADINEPQWYAMTSITARLDDGRTLTHEYSGGHPGYNHYETENKIDQALASAGPRTCKNIDGIWSGCPTCDYYGKVTSPIMIKSDNYISSSDFGYRERRVDKNGMVRPGKPAYMDLIRTFELEQPYVMMDDTGVIFTYDGRKWGPISDARVKAWAMGKVRPEPTVAEQNEFLGMLKAFHVTSLEEFYSQSEGLVPFKNVVLNRRTGEVLTHSPEQGFFHTLGFDYDPRATAPRWDRFLLEIMDGNKDLVELLKEYGGYCISGDSSWLQKCLLMVGDGANGKSVFMEVLGAVAGKAAHSAIPMQNLESDTLRYQLVNKLFNYSEETSMRALADSSIFKTLVTGGVMSVKQLYIQPYQLENRAKLILSANDMPTTSDKSHGLYRRLVIVKLRKQFNAGDEGHDPFLKEKLMLELPGIANGLMKAYERLKHTRMLSGQKEIAEEIDTYKSTSDTVQMFYENHIEITTPDEDTFERASEVYDTYRNMCEQTGFKPVHMMAFAHQLTRINPNFSEWRDRRVLGGSRVRVINRIKLNKEF